MDFKKIKITGFDSFENNYTPGFDYFGYSVSLSSAGNTALVGAYGYNNDGGAAYIFTGSGNNWNQTARISGKDIPPFSNNFDRFGWSTALNSGGNIALIGSPAQYSSSGGAAYIFERIGNSWNEKVKINAGNNAAELDYFGRSVALNAAGNVALVGTIFSLPSPPSQNRQIGAAYIFTGSGSNWVRTARISGNDNSSFDYFGNAVSLNAEGNVALIGAYGKNGFSGAAYIFTGSGNNWNQVAKITGNDALLNKQFGLSVALNAEGNVALVGANIGGFNTATGSAYIFTGSGSSWTQVAKISGEGDDNYAFGNKVSLNSAGNIALIGATRSAYIFVNSGNSWIKKTKITGGETAFNFHFGNNVSLNSSGDIALIGSFSEQTNGINYLGAAYIFTEKLNQTITFSAIPTKTFGDSPFFLDATATSNLPVTFSGNNSSVATIVGSGVTIVGAGACEITAYQTGNFDYSAATPVARTLNVLRGSQTINLPSFYTGVYNETKVYDASTPQGLPLIYTGNTNIFSISANNITFINTGVTILTGYNTGNLNYTGITGTQQVTVNRAEAIIDFPYIPLFNVNITSGYTLNATSNHNESTITYTSSNSGAASISGANTLLITGTGIGIITAYQPATSHYNEASDQRSFTALNLRTPQIVAVSNLPNNVFFDTGSKYIQGYLQDEGVYNLKLHILEDNILCEKTLKLTCYNPSKKYIYKVNYPINIGFIKYNPLERLGVFNIPDADARKYFAKTNISNALIQNKISDFVGGLKNLNVWDKLENIWIFRSEYNLASGASGFIDLKNPNFSGYISSPTNLVDHRSSGYKFVNNNSRFNLSDSIRFTGANISMFSVLQSNKTALPHVPFSTLLGPENYQQSGFRFGINETLNFRKWFRLWNTESIPSNGFQVGTNATGQGSEYSFLSAGIQNSGTGFIQINNEPASTSTGSYKEYGPGITAFPSLAGGTNVIPNRIAFFAISKQNILNNHSGLMNLVKSTICADLNL